MSGSLRFLVVSLLTLMIAHPSPAPIVEPEEKPTPKAAPEQTEAPKPKTKRSGSKSTVSDAEPAAKSQSRPAPAPALGGPARFAGTWNGRINQTPLGHVRTSLTIDPNATSVALSHNLGGGTRPLTVNGNAASWKTGAMGEIAWTLTPNNDGQTAQVTMKGLMANDTTTFRRGQISSASSPTKR